MLARDEGKLIALKQKYPDIEIYTGDISDPTEVRQACKDVDGIFHLVAFKHVGLPEKALEQFVSDLKKVHNKVKIEPEVPKTSKHTNHIIKSFKG